MPHGMLRQARPTAVEARRTGAEAALSASDLSSNVRREPPPPVVQPPLYCPDGHTQQPGNLLDRDVRVVVQQDGLPLPCRQTLDEIPQPRVVLAGSQRGLWCDSVGEVAVARDTSPVVAGEIRGDEEHPSSRIAHPTPTREQPRERLLRDVNRSSRIPSQRLRVARQRPELRQIQNS